MGASKEKRAAEERPDLGRELQMQHWRWKKEECNPGNRDSLKRLEKEWEWRPCRPPREEHTSSRLSASFWKFLCGGIRK